MTSGTEQGSNSAGFRIEHGDRRGVPIVAFAGLYQRRQLDHDGESDAGSPSVAPPGRSARFEFFRLLARFDNRCIFMADHENAWYQLGVRGVGDTVDSVAVFLRERLGDECSNAVFVGASAGGFAAMLFGSMLGVAEVHAFAAQTFVSRGLRRVYRDGRWPSEIGRMHSLRGSRPAYLDVKPVLRGTRPSAGAVHLHVGSQVLDARHARRVARVPGVQIHRYERVPGHDVAAKLNERGLLQGIIEDAIGRADAGAPEPG